MTEINWNYIIYRYRYSIDLMDKFRDADIITEKDRDAYLDIRLYNRNNNKISDEQINYIQGIEEIIHSNPKSIDVMEGDAFDKFIEKPFNPKDYLK